MQLLFAHPLDEHTIALAAKSLPSIRLLARPPTATNIPPPKEASICVERPPQNEALPNPIFGL